MKFVNTVQTEITHLNRTLDGFNQTTGEPLSNTVNKHAHFRVNNSLAN